MNKHEDSEKVRMLREFTGEGMVDCHKALKICQGDVLLACGYMKYAGCAINLKGGNHREWALNAGRRYASELAFDADGKIAIKPIAHQKPIEPGM